MHFVNQAIIGDGESSDYDEEYYEYNITETIPALIQWLSKVDDGDDYLTSYVYTKLTGMYNETVSQSFALRLLMHYIGDVHQPLHSSNRYSSEYPSGDEGGNFFTLASHDGVKNLHSAWDSLIYS